MSAKASGVSYEDLCVEILQMAELNLHSSANWKP